VNIYFVSFLLFMLRCLLLPFFYEYMFQ